MREIFSSGIIRLLFSYIEVDYYRKNAPQALTLILSILALAGLALLVEYYFSIRKLRASRMKERRMR